MEFRDEAYDVKLQIKAEGCVLTDRDRAMIEEDLDGLRPLLEAFPVADLHLHVHQHARTEDYHVTASLRLPKRVLFTGDRQETLQAACQRSIRKLKKKTQALKEQMSKQPEKSKAVRGKSHEIVADRTPDVSALERAAHRGDFIGFRRLMGPYDATLQKAVGRWVERYPDLAARLGRDFVVSELVDEVCLTAFEQFSERPDIRLGDWLKGLIDPSIRRVLVDPYTEKNLIGLLRDASSESAS